MDTDQLRSGLARLASDLTLAGEPIALDVVVARHLAVLREARAARLRWASIAKLLAEAGAQRLNGGLISADQLRASYSRAGRHGCQPPGLEQNESARTPSVEELSARAPPRGASIARPAEPAPDLGRAGTAKSFLAQRFESSGRAADPDFTAEELASVRARLKAEE